MKILAKLFEIQKPKLTKKMKVEKKFGVNGKDKLLS